MQTPRPLTLTAPPGQIKFPISDAPAVIGGKWTKAENTIHKMVGPPFNEVELGKKLGGKLHFPTADCMKIICKGKTYCIGSDKIGHAFQQGHMLWEVANMTGDVNIANAFSKWTEGLLSGLEVNSGTDNAGHNIAPAITDFLMTGNITFYGFKPGDTSILLYQQRWGGVVNFAAFGLAVAQVSPGDDAANRAGMSIYKEIMKGKPFKFDLPHEWWARQTRQLRLASNCSGLI